MRVVTLDRRDTGWRVGYRWADDLLSPARLLMDSADVPLDRLRQMLERDFFGEAMRPEIYQVVALVQTDSALEAIRTAFGDLSVSGVPRNEQTAAVLQHLAVPNAAFDPVLALTYWQIEPPDFAALFDQLDNGFIGPFAEYATDPAYMRADFANLRASISTALVGQSARALREVYAQLTGSELRVPVAPSQAVIQVNSFCGLPLRVIDGRASDANTALNEMPLCILAVASDPGVGAGELLAIQNADKALIALANTHSAPEDYAAMKGYIQAQLSTVQVVDAAEIAVSGRVALGTIIRQKLLLWLTTHFVEISESAYMRRTLEHVQHLIMSVTAQ